MDDVRRYLEAGDPVRREPGLSPVEVRVLRQVTLGAQPVRSRHPQAVLLALAASLAAVVGAGAWIIRSRPLEPTPPSANTAGGSTGQFNNRRQLYFLTPGGTRVIWTLNLKPTEGTP